MRLASLGSGSKGNATLVVAADTRILIDCGFSVRETRRRLERLDESPADLDAILVTHEHGDHAAGVAALSRAFSIPVYATHGTHSTGRIDGCSEMHCFNTGEELSIGGLRVSAVAVPHDAREPCQYRLAADSCEVGVLTDLGSVTPHVVEAFRGCHALVLEFNHDVHMLAAGDYPPALKRRVGGDWGHLNNHQASELLAALDGPDLRHVAIAHISEKNNCELAVRAILADAHPHWLERVIWADQKEGFDWVSLD